MKHYYIAGPFTASTDLEIEQNILRAEAVAARIITKDPNAVCIVPHSFGRMFKHGPGDADYWYRATMSMLERCDTIVLVKGWSFSAGSRREHKRALQLGKEILHEVYYEEGLV